MTVLAIANQKGGVGKTTTTHNLGHALHEAGKQVLLVDLDQRADLTVVSALNPDELEHNIYDLMYQTIKRKQRMPIEDVIVSTEVGIDVLPASEELSGAQADLMTTVAGDAILKQILADVRGRYDYILVDTPADLNLLTINALVAADRVLIPIQTEFLSAKGGRRLLETVGVVRERLNPNLTIDGLLLTMVTYTLISQEITEATYRTFNEHLPVYETTIRRRVDLASAQRRFQSVFEYKPSSDAAEDYRNLAKEVMSHD